MISFAHVFSNATIKSKFESNQDEVHPSSLEDEDIQCITECEQDIQIGLPVKKSMESMSRSTFGSVIDDFIEDDFEKPAHLKFPCWWFQFVHLHGFVFTCLIHQYQLPDRIPEQENSV